MSIRWTKRLSDTTQLNEIQGFGAVQLPVASVMAPDAADFSRERERMLATGLSFEVFDSPLPREVRVTERGFNLYTWTEYLKAAVSRLSELGCRTLVWGDGRARLLPIEGEISTLKEQFYQFVFLLCEISERQGINVCLEPLGPRRTNFLNTPQEALDSLALIGRGNLGLTVSLRGLVEMEALDISAYKASVLHLHLDNPTSLQASMAPSPSDGYDYAPFFQTLRKIGYEGSLSLPEDATTESLDYCKALWEKSSGR